MSETKPFSTAAEVKAEVDKLLADHQDTESSHGTEDWICEMFVRSVARGTAQDPVGMAKEIERMLDAGLDRWYA